MPPLPDRSWGLPSPTIFTDSDPNACNGKEGVGTVLINLRPHTERPDWQAVVNGVAKKARVYQAEGFKEADDALLAIAADAKLGEIAEGSAIVTNGLSKYYYDAFARLGVTSIMPECYGQAGPQPGGYPYSNITRMKWQVKNDGGYYVVPALGIYDEWGLQRYIDLNGGAANFAKGHWRGGPLAFYLGEGLTDTGSWSTLAGLFH